MYDIILENIKYFYGDHLALNDINLKINSGEFICLLGPSGSGKSTLLRLISGLSNPNSGQILIGGKKITEPGPDRGVVFQDYSLFPWISTGENIVLALEQAFPNKQHKELKEIAIRYLNLVGLPNVYNKMINELSGGMSQRVAIAREFAVNPPILLMDEPFGALDAVTRARVQDLLLHLWENGDKAKKTIIFITHDVEEALILADRIVVLGSNPGVIKEICKVNLPRPRLRQRLYTDSNFVSLRNHLIELLNEDILKQLNKENNILSKEGEVLI